MADVDGDGRLELVASIATGFTEGYMVLLDDDGDVLWREQLDFNPGTVILADLDGRGDYEVVLAGRVASSTVYVYSIDGRLLWSGYLGDWVDNIVVADVDGDDMLEVIAGTWGYEKAWKYDGKLLWTYTGTTHSSAPSAIGDIDGDGLPDVVVSTTELDGRIHVLKGSSGEPLWVYGPLDARVLGVTVNADGDEEKEVLVLVRRVEDLKVTKLLLLDNDGNELWERDVDYAGILPLWPAYVKQGFTGADLDDDGVDEAVFYTSDGRVSIISTSDGGVIREFDAGCRIVAGGITVINNDFYAAVGCNNSVLLLNLGSGFGETTPIMESSELVVRGVMPFNDTIVVVGCGGDSQCSIIVKTTEKVLAGTVTVVKRIDAYIIAAILAAAILIAALLFRRRRDRRRKRRK